MPIYEYRCKDCNLTKTITRSFSEKEEEYSCESCNSSLTRVYSSIGVTFNGSGFYSTDR